MKLSRTLLSTALVAALSHSQIALADDNLPGSVWGLTADHRLFNVASDAPSVIRSSTDLSGVDASDQLVGIDYRVAYGDMYALAKSGQIYLIDPRSGVASKVEGSAPVSFMRGEQFGFDFNPAADKMRVVGDGDLNLRLHPDNGSVIDFDKDKAGLQTDPLLTFTPEGANAGERPDIVAAAYTYNSENEKLTTNYAIDRRLDALMMQGTKEGVTPGVSPNLGVLYTIGSLGQGDVVDATLDISDIHNVALATLQLAGEDMLELYKVDLDSGAATSLGVFGMGVPVIGLAIEP